jgi:hypothetical protein
MHRDGPAGIPVAAILLAALWLSAAWAQTNVAAGAQTEGAGRPTPGGTSATQTRPAESDAKPPAPDGRRDGGAPRVPIDLKLPKPAFKGTPKHVPPGTNLEKPRDKPREPFLAPPGTTNVALGKEVTSSDHDPIVGELKLVTDGDKAAAEGAYVELGPGTQWVQIDLKQGCAIHALVVWHYHINARVYRDVVVQLADDPDFISNVRTLFSNDHDNSSGLGAGESQEYWETYEGKLIDAKGAQARYVRLYSKGSTSDDQNHYVEVEVWGSPVE